MFGDLVRAHRRQLGLTQEELAEKAGVTARSIGKIEAGRVATPRPGTVRLLADALGLTGANREKFNQSASSLIGNPSNGIVPGQLPPDVVGFTGREAQLRYLDKLVTGVTGSPPAAVVISALSGTAGVGKTALAVHWAHRVADRFPDGQLYVNLRGFDGGGRAMTAPADAVRAFLDALGVPPKRIPVGVDAQVGLFRSLITGKRILIVLDNARDTEQVRPLLPGTPTAVVVVTSRNQLTPLAAAVGIHPLTLDLLSTQESRDLLSRRLGPARVAAEPQAVDQIIDACARLPLALTIAAARAQQREFPLAVLAAELNDPGRLDALDAGDEPTQVRAVLSWSYATLTPAAARLFRLLGIHPGPDISAAAAASIVGEAPPHVHPLLTELCRANLLIEHEPGRYSFHDLLRAFAAEVGGNVDSDDQRRTALRRLLDHYTCTAHAADRMLHPRRDPIRLTLARLAADVYPEEVVDDRSATEWLSTERRVLLAAIGYAMQESFDIHAWQLAWILDTFLYRHGRYADHAAALRSGVRAARRLGESGAQAFAHRRLADNALVHGRDADANNHLRCAAVLFVRAEDLAGQGDVAHSRGKLSLGRGDFPRALRHAEQALALFKSAGNRRREAMALNSIGWCHALLGDHQQALAFCERALIALRELDDPVGQATVWDSLGYANHGLGRYAEAVECYRQALALFNRFDDRYDAATTFSNLADVHHAVGDLDAARNAWVSALDILTELGHHDAQRVQAKLDRLP